MISTKTSLRIAWMWMAGVFLLVACVSESPDQKVVRKIEPSTIALAIYEDTQNLTRPRVEFDHERHTSELKQEGCETCHLIESDAFLFKFGRKDDLKSGEELMELYHEKCIDCHKSREEKGEETGPRVCAGCHAKKDKGVDKRMEARFDYSLHMRHVAAVGDDKCDTCHHQYDETAKKLVYKKGEEDACRDCHGQKDEGKNLSLKNASHLDCVNCHLDAESKGQEHGPTLCVGCHDKKSIAERKKIDKNAMPRLERGQKDTVLISLKGAESVAVPFNHKAHENRAEFCTTCHHKTPRPCKECHTLKGTEEGKGVTASMAYHEVSSDRSCVGCHLTKVAESTCAGCHDFPLNRTWPSMESCAVCHKGSASKNIVDAGMGKVVEMKNLPKTSDDFPESVEIKILSHEYKPSKMPHRKMVERLDGSIRKSELAVTFHRNVETVCMGCHHNSPVTKKPRPCFACHGMTAEETSDKPGLKNAYHRQCMGCHESMNIKEAMGCTDCHEKAAVVEVKQ